MSAIEHDESFHVKDHFLIKNKRTVGFITHGNYSKEKIKSKTLSFRHKLRKKIDDLVESRDHTFRPDLTYNKQKRLLLERCKENTRNHLL